jgi:uncharacterized protein DUF4386
MSAHSLTLRTRKASPRLMARLAGMFYVFAVGTAVYAEFIAPGTMGWVAIVVPVACYSVVTLLLYVLLRPVNPALALLAMVSGLAGLAFEALRWQPHGVNLGMTLHGLFCLFVGSLLFRSALLPRILGVLMAFAGLVWLLYLFPALAGSLAPVNSFAGLLGEGVPMLWLLFLGVDPRR